MAPYLSNPSSQIMPAGPPATQQQIPIPHITLGPLFHPIQEQAGNALPWNPDRDVSVVYVDDGDARVNPRALDQDILPLTPEDVAARDEAIGGPSHLVTLSNGSQALRITTLSGEPRDNNTRIHQHVDLGVPSGTRVRTPRDGVVLYDGFDQGRDNNGKGFGNFRCVLHEDAGYYYVAIYAHLGSYNDNTQDANAYQNGQAGDEVTAGTAIAMSGDSGAAHTCGLNGAPGPHLDYGLYRIPKRARRAREMGELTEGRNPRYDGAHLDQYDLAQYEKDLIKNINNFLGGTADTGDKIYRDLRKLTQDSPRLGVTSRIYSVDPLNAENWPQGSGAPTAPRNPRSMSGLK
ncbi:M23 family metallopeptidase [Candidatus Woesearchaeota archaeon]|nr:M23 family metallopeptidase [Candidatus Woesearchaeota archaeon]